MSTHKLTKVIVDRKKWYRGKGGDHSKLLIVADDFVADTDVGKMCCLGFAALALGIPKSLITGMQTPRDLPHQALHLETDEVAKLTLAQVAWCLQSFDVLMEANDAELVAELVKAELVESVDEDNDRYCVFTSNAEREAYLKARGVKVGLDFEFVN